MTDRRGFLWSLLALAGVGGAARRCDAAPVRPVAMLDFYRDRAFERAVRGVVFMGGIGSGAGDARLVQVIFGRPWPKGWSGGLIAYPARRADGTSAWVIRQAGHAPACPIVREEDLGQRLLTVERRPWHDERGLLSGVDEVISYTFTRRQAQAMLVERGLNGDQCGDFYVNGSGSSRWLWSAWSANG